MDQTRTPTLSSCADGQQASDSKILPIWVDSGPDATAAISIISQHRVVGLDTEFYGWDWKENKPHDYDIRSESPVLRTRAWTFQVAAPTGPLLPRGHHEATSWVFSGDLITHTGVKAWLEDPKYVKAVHNQPVDHHTLRNHGVLLRGGCNTLEMSRFWYPARAKRAGFDLDSLGRDLVGLGKTESFDSLLGYEALEPYVVTQLKSVCTCFTVGCRKKKPERDGTVHEPAGQVEVQTTRERKVRRHIPLGDLVPGHPLWERYLAYAAWDAVLALAIWEIMTRAGRNERPYPWTLF